MKYEDISSVNNFPGEEIPGAEEVQMGPLSMGTPSEVEYQEGIFVGYRYFLTKNIPVAYPFGYGISYTNFNYSDFELSSTEFDNHITASITIKNVGDVAGKEVVQLYLSAPGKSMEKPVAELKGFAKTKLLTPGESETLTFELDARDLSSFDENRSAWIAEPGTYTVKIGASSTDIKSSETFQLSSELEVEKVNDVLKPQSIMPNN